MTQKSFLGVNIAYNGNSPRVSINISLRGFFAGLWQNVKDFWNRVVDLMEQAKTRRSVYVLNAYSILSWLLIIILLIKVIKVVGATNCDLQQMWQMWAEFLSQYGLVTMPQQIGVLVLSLALFRVICDPITKWEQYYIKTKLDKSMTKDIRWQLLIQRADATVAKMNSVFTWICGGIVAVAAVTAIVRTVWTML